MTHHLTYMPPMTVAMVMAAYSALLRLTPEDRPGAGRRIDAPTAAASTPIAAREHERGHLVDVRERHLQADEDEHGSQSHVQVAEPAHHPGEDEGERGEADEREGVRGVDDERVAGDREDRRYRVGRGDDVEGRDGTVIFALAFQGIAALPGLEGAKPYPLPQQFDAWEALFGQTGVSMGRAGWTCALHTLVPLAAGWAIFARRDVAGARPVLLAGRS